MSDVFLLGAGFSKAISSHMPLLAELSELLRKRVDLPDYVTNLGDNIEHWMTYLSQPQPWISEIENLRHKAMFLELSRQIDLLLHERMQQVLNGNCPEWLTGLIRWWHDSHSHVITLNYDTLIERAAGLIPITENIRLSTRHFTPVRLPDVNRSSMWGIEDIPTFKLYKLHGSVNWYYSGSASYFGETIYSSLVPGWDQAYNQAEIQSEIAAEDKLPLIIPPTSEKVAYFQHETIRQLWARAGENLALAERVYIVGYSFPETDLSIRFFLRNNRWSNRTIFVVNIEPTLPDHYRKMLGDCENIDATYLGEDAISLLVGELARGV